MSEDSDSKPYHYPGLEGPDGRSACRGASPCSSMAQLHRMGGFGAARPDLDLPSEGSDSSGLDPPPAATRQGARSRSLREDDAEMKSSGSSGSGNESHGNESHGNDSHGNESTASSNGNSKDSALLESSGSNKSSNSHSLSPPGSSNAFSLLSGSSEQDNPSTSGCSSEESAKAKTQKELLKTLKELKQLLPAEKRSKGNKSSTLNTLKYALRCVRQVEANEEYYQMLMMNDSQPSGLDVSSYTIEEIDRITSEYTLKNNDMFAVAVSLVTGKIVYISDQAASILNCKRGVFKDAKFAEFLTPQDVSLFYTFTTPYRLPSWGMCTGAESSGPDCTQEKSFFCRIGGGKECEGDLRYYPFRMTPYLMKVQDRVQREDQFCCLLLAERVHSGYEAPRIPTDKRIFTTTHTPSCVFQDVDERAVPLLGYLPQDLIGTQVLLHLHPKDRPIMLAIHKKILQYAGQPFDHSSIRFCARNGEYVVVDTSWSSFVNPWSRKVSFVIGRHKVRMGPVNEDVFVSPLEVKGVDPDVQEITEQIHRLLLQTVHNNGSSGYGSLDSNDHLLGTTSSSESTGNDNGSRTLTTEEEGESSKTKPRTFQEICKGIQRQKSQEQQVYLSSSAKPDTKKSNGKSQQKSPAVVRPKDSTAPLSWKETGGGGALEEVSRTSATEELAFNDQTVYSYQQISCLDSVIRYLESCNVPITMKRKCHSSSNTTSSNSDEDKQRGADPMQVSGEQALLKAPPLLSPLDDADKKPTGTATAVVGTSLAPLALPSKAESVLSITSQCSYSSTIVHVGDKKPQPESEIIEDVSGAGEAGEASQTTGPHSSAVSPPSQEREPYKKLGLTKQVLAAHTENEEQAFLYRFRELRGVKAFKADCSHYLERRRGRIASDAVPAAHPCRHGGAGESARRGRRGKRTRSKRAKQNESSGSAESLPQRRRRRQPRSAPLRAQVPGAYPLQAYPGAGAVPPRPDPSLHGFGDRDPRGTPSVQSYSASLVAPMVALVLPNYVLPQMGSGPPPQQPFYQLEAGCFPGHPQPYAPQTAYPGQGSYPPQVSFSIQAQFHPQNPFAPQMGFPAQPFAFSLSPGAPKPPGEGQSRPSTPQSVGARDQASPPLFQSRCSSPLQLNLLQLEESQRSLERQDSAAPPSGPQGNNAGAEMGCAVGQAQEEELQKVGSHGDGNQSDGNSSSCDLLDILLHEDSRSSTGSATSGSMGSGLNGCGMSASGTSNSRTSASGASASGTGSNNSSNYFGSVDSSQNSQKVKGHSSGEQESGSNEGRPMEVEQSQHFKCVLQDPLWLLRANAEDKVMMTYQLPSRDIQRVLRGDRERLKVMQSRQPCFTGGQKKELLEVHPWLRRGGLPKAINVKACVCCDDAFVALASEEHSDLDMGETEMETAELGSPRKPRDEPSNTDINPCPCSPGCDS